MALFHLTLSHHARHFTVSLPLTRMSVVCVMLYKKRASYAEVGYPPSEAVFSYFM
jgi:hypothetical protein